FDRSAKEITLVFRLIECGAISAAFRRTIMNLSQRKALLRLVVTLTILWGRLAAEQALWRIANLQ
ncbi:MAG TPA: hypothetical protein VG759_11380, partial [Candidatus Angelobacter sp.]|nr:hypothetical protein [Candidatus Angelobacter sp.]